MQPRDDLDKPPLDATTTADTPQQSDKVPPAKAAKTVKKRASKKKDKNKPKRPLSAYNYFFKEERQRILAILNGGEGVDNEPGSENFVSEEDLEKLRGDKSRVVFEEMAKLIGGHWKNVSREERDRLKALARDDLDRYNQQLQQHHLRELQPPPTVPLGYDRMMGAAQQMAGGAPYGSYPHHPMIHVNQYQGQAQMMHQNQHISPYAGMHYNYGGSSPPSSHTAGLYPDGRSTWSPYAPPYAQFRHGATNAPAYTSAFPVSQVELASGRSPIHYYNQAVSDSQMQVYPNPIHTQSAAVLGDSRMSSGTADGTPAEYQRR